MTASTLADQLRQLGYTGGNQCTSCTVVDVIIAATLGLVFGVAWPPLRLVPSALSAGVIYFRGCLIPGTPTFTKTYFPDWALHWFDKEPTQTRVGTTVSMPGLAADGDVDAGSSGEEIESGQLGGGGAPVTTSDAGTTLMGAGMLELDESGDRLRLIPSFELVWDDEIACIDETVAR